MKYILVPLMALFVASCSPARNSTANQPQDVRYNEALEYDALMREHEAYLRQLWEQRRAGPLPDSQEQTLRRFVHLQDAIESWKDEAPDKRVAKADRKAVNRIIEYLFKDPASRARMVLKTFDLDMCERVIIQFHNGNRCFVRILFYDRAPTAKAGLNVYLFKHDGQWKTLHRSDWIL